MNVLIPALAQTTNQPPSPGGLGFLFPAIMIAMIVFMLLTARSQKKREKRERDEMHARLAKNDRVLTIGGAVGTVIAVKEDEVVLKVDESTNTKMTFIKTSVQKILSEEQETAPPRK